MMFLPENCDRAVTAAEQLTVGRSRLGSPLPGVQVTTIMMIFPSLSWELKESNKSDSNLVPLDVLRDEPDTSMTRTRIRRPGLRHSRINLTEMRPVTVCPESDKLALARDCYSLRPATVTGLALGSTAANVRWPGQRFNLASSQPGRPLRRGGGWGCCR